MAGNEPAVMAETARRLVDEGAELIDINLVVRQKRCVVELQAQHCSGTLIGSRYC